MVLAALEQLRVTPDQVIELRGLGIPTRYGRPRTAAGWFDDLSALARAACELEARGAQVYVTLNPVNPALLARAFNRVVDFPKHTTTDHDVIWRAWLPIDIDPVRPAGTSSSEPELDAARTRALAAAEWLTKQLGEPPRIWACSGNGYHMLFRIDLPNDDKATAMVKGVLDQTAERFSDEQVNVDRTVYNAARIWRLYGTINRKGDSVERLGRVHRRAVILKEGFSS